MKDALTRIREILDQEGVEYELIHHRLDYQASEAAADTHTPPAEFAKTIFLWVDGAPAMAVLPASKQLSLSKVQHALTAEHVRLAREEETHAVCPDCEVGAAPPFGNLYDVPVYVSPSLTEDDRITFNAGTHRDAIRMPYADFERLVGPRVIRMAKHD
jgi:Ala-tRNA(Pro) deacylase